MKVENVVEITKKAVAQTMGIDYQSESATLSAIETGKLIDVGRDIADMEKGYDTYCKALIDVIGKYEFDVFNYDSEIKSLYKDAFEWGAFVERVKFNINVLEDDDLLNIASGKDYSNYEHRAYIPTINAKSFSERKGVVIPLTIKTSDLETAFTSLTEMGKFISSIREAREQTRKIILDTYAHALVSSAIAISDKVTSTSIHLLTEAKEEGIIEPDSTLNDVRNNTKFNNFCLKRIATIRDYLKRHTSGFNNKTVIPASGETNLFLLSEFEKDCKFSSLSDTYHNENLTVGNYDVVTSWQGIKDEENYYDFDTLSTVKINDSNNKLGIGDVVECSNCVALLTDYKALGIYNEKVKITSSYTASADFWNEFEHVIVNYTLDADYSMVAFMLD